MPKYLKQEGGAVPLLLLLAAVGLIAFLVISNTFNFKDRLFNTLFPKPPSHAATFVESVNCGYGSFKVGNWPTSCWRPYADYTPFSQPVPANPKLALNSANVVSTWFSKIPQHITVGQSQIAGADWNHPVYYSQPTDPVYTITCTKYGGGCAIKGASIRIPVGAKPASGGDGHMSIIDQSTNTEYDFWQASIPSGTGGSLSISWGGKTNITGDGLKSDATAAWFGTAAGNIRAVEWDGGIIDHALFITIYCDNGTYVYPAAGLGRACSSINLANSTAAPMGSRFYLDLDNTAIDALSIPGWKKTILKAMHNYGMYLGDTGGSTWEVKTESGRTYTSFGQADPMVAFAKKYLGQQVYDNGNGSYDFDLSMSGAFYQDHLHMIDPCVTQIGTADCSTATPSPSSISSATPPILSSPTPSISPTDTVAPSVAITYPTNGSTVSRKSTVNIQASAADDVGIAKVEFYINNSLKYTDTTSPYSYNWNVPGKPGVSYIITAKAYDGANNTNTSSITVSAI